MIDFTALSVGIAGIIIVLGVFLIKASSKTKISGVIPLLILGIIIGPITGLFEAAKYSSAIPSLVTLAIVVVLFDVGSGLSVEDLKRDMLPALGLTVLASLITGAAAYAFGYFVLNLSVALSLLLGALVMSTDLAVVAPLLENLKITPKMRNVLDIEATLNSVFAAVVAIVAVGMINLGENFTALQATQTFLYYIFAGLGLGAILGWVIVLAVKHLKLEEKPHIISIGSVLLTYSITELIGASGIVAALTVGIIFRNSGQDLPRVIKQYGGDLELLLITFIYVLLGALLDFKVLLDSLLVSASFVVLVLIARVIAAKIYTLKGKDPEDTKIIFFAGPRGIVTAVLVLQYSSMFIGVSSTIIAMILFTIISTIVVSSFVPAMSFGVPSPADGYLKRAKTKRTATRQVVEKVPKP